MIEGLLLIDKPTGWTSFDVVNKVRGVVAAAEGKKPRQIKVGHTGTLDPMATGLLVICVGKTYTRLSADLTSSDKTYEFTAKLGASSTTGDEEGEIITYKGAKKPAQDELVLALGRFMGEIEQTPPVYSAIKVNGKRAYERARKGEEVVIPSRKVTIHSLELVDYNYPDFTGSCSVSKGTYIRTLAEDIAKELDTHAYVTALRRTKLSRYEVKKAQGVENIDYETIKKQIITLNEQEITTLTLVK